MLNPLESLLSDPWQLLETVVDGPLHPGGTDGTRELLDRAGVGADTRLLDVGCGAGESVRIARERGADAVGLDRDPRTGRAVRGDMARLPVRTDAVDVVLAECVLSLSPDRARTLAEIRRVLAPGGRLALSGVVVEGDAPELPETLAEAFCLTDARSRAGTVAAVESAGFEAGEVRDHREAVLDMRDEIAGKIDYERLLGALGERGRRTLDGVERLEAAVDSGEVGYVSLVATPEP